MVSFCFIKSVKHCVAPTQCIEALLWISESTAMICPYIINSLVFITERRCAYCAVRAVFLKCNAVNRSWKPGFDARSVLVRFVVDRVALGRHFSPSTSVFSLPVLFHQNLRIPLRLLLDCWLEVSIRKVLRPATSTQVFLGFPVSTSEC